MEEDLLHALDLAQAKRLLREIHFDLIIVDLNIPELIGEESVSDMAGLDFLEELVDTDMYVKPKDIVILTAFDELIEKSKAKKGLITFPILKYNETSLEWQEVIESKIKYCLVYDLDKKRVSEYNYDVAIITAIPTETNKVLSLYPNNDKENIDNDPTNYYTNKVKTTSKDIKIVCAQQSEMGIAAASTLTCKIIDNFRPRYVIMCGIAAGIGGGKNYGDIIVATEVWNYSSGKYIESKENEELVSFDPDPKSISLDPMIVNMIDNDYDIELFNIKKSWNQKIDTDLNVIFGSLACGSAVVANKSIVDKLIKAHSRKTVGLDMESYGIYYSVENYTGMKPTAICIKSICDFADSKKDDDFQGYAAYTSANFVKYLIENILKY